MSAPCTLALTTSLTSPFTTFPCPCNNPHLHVISVITRYAHSIELTQLDDDELGGHVPSPHDEEDPLDDEYLGGDDDDDDDLFLSARPGPSKKA